MAQKTEKEETEIKVVPEAAINPCVNNCGLSGSPAMNNMCQKCFNSTTSTSTSKSSSVASAAGGLIFGEKSNRSSSSKRSSPERTTDRAEVSRDLKDDVKETSSTTTTAAPLKREIYRCSGCYRKVGLTGFRCRCGDLFCSAHRYSDRHDCSYDYKAAGREAIARENPVVKAAKIVKL